MKLKTTTILPMIAALTFQVSVAGNEAQLLPDGEFRSVDGSGRPTDCAAWRVDAEIAAVLVAEIAARINPLVIDYEHATLKKAIAKGEEAPAAGWFKQIEYRPGKGIYATDVEWNTRAKQLIAADEYRYISCVFKYDKTGRVTHILHAALTNFPALDGMDEVFIAALAASLSSEQPNQEQQNMDELLEQLRWLLNLPVGATAEDVQAQLQKLIDQLSGGQGTAAASANIPQLLAQQQQNIAALTAQIGMPDPAKFVSVEVMHDLHRQVAALSAQVNESKVADLVDVALSEGKLLPSQEAWARNLGASNIAALSAYLETTPGIAALSGTQTGGLAPEGAKRSASADPEFLAVCAAFGNDPTAVSATMKEQE